MSMGFRAASLLGVIAVAALFVAMGVATVPPSPGQYASAPPLGGRLPAAAVPAGVGPGAAEVSAARNHPSVIPDHLNGSLPNTLVGAPCNNLPERQVAQAVDPTTGYVYEAFIGCTGIGFARSIDGGYSFQPAYYLPDSNSHLITNPDGTKNGSHGQAGPEGGTSPARPITYLDNSSAWDPGIAIAPNGTIYVVYSLGYLDGYLPGAQPAVAWSDNHGASFQGYENVTTWWNGTYNDRPTIAVAPNGTVYVAWTYAPYDNVTCPPGVTAPCINGTAPAWLWCVTKNSCAFERGQYQIVIAASYNGGRNWTAPWNVTPIQTHTQSVTAEIQVTADGTIDALVQQFNSTGAPLWLLGVGEETFTQSTDGGVTWSTPRILSDLNFSNSTWWVDGSLQIDSSGTLWVGFDSYEAAENVSTAWAISSTNGGFSWSTPLALSQGSGLGATVDVTVAGNGSGGGFAMWEMNNTTGHYWEAWGRALSDNATSEGPILLISQQAGYPSDWVGNTLGVTSLFGDAYALGFTVGAYQPVFGNTQSEVFFATVGLALPPAPTATTLTPGDGQILVSWNETPGDPTVAGFLIQWYLDGGINVGNLTLGASARSAILPNITAFVRFEVTVAAVNGAGAGPIGPTGNITLMAWSIYEGTVDPATATVLFDGSPVPVVDGSYLVNTTFGGHAFTVSAPNYATTSLAEEGTWNGTFWENFSLSLLPSVVRGVVFPATSTVTWDGTPIALTDGAYEVTAAADTNHTLNVTFHGFVPASILVSVPANTTVWQNVTLRPLPGTLYLVVVPASAEVWVNGTMVTLAANGTADVTLPAGTYPIRATAPEYQVWVSDATLLPGQLVNVSVTLTKNSTPVQNITGPTTTPLYLSPFFLGGLAALGIVLVAIYLLAVRHRREEERRPQPEVPVDESELERERQLGDRVPDPPDESPPS